MPTKLLTSRWIDCSMPIHPQMVRWPSHGPIQIVRTRSFERGDDVALTELAFNAHTGTHVDAPAHFLPGGTGVDEAPAEALIGPCRVVPIRDPRAITVEELRALRIRRGERLLFRTANSSRPQQAFAPEFVYCATEAAQWLARRRVRAIGIDALSIGGYKRNSAQVHRALLGAGIWIIEGLVLQHVPAGRYELCCLPLRIVGADGAPARALVRPAGRS